MKFKGIIETVGKVCASCGALATPFTSFFLPVSIISVVATYVGWPTAFFDPMKRHLWASFGIYHK